MTDVDNVDNVDNPLESPGTEDYKLLHDLILSWYTYQAGTITPEMVDRQFDIRSRTGKQNRWIILERLVKQSKLKKGIRGYRVVDNTLDHVDWLNAAKDDTYKNFRWPKGRDGTGFEFDGFTTIYPNDIIAIAGVSNQGKTSIALNILVENMDTYTCRLMGNEIYPNRFASRMRHFDWVTLINEQSAAKFEVIRVTDNNYEDKILPGAINIIDWLRPPANYWEIGNVAMAIQSKLEGGIAVLVTQKSEGKQFGRGGDSLRDVSSVYLTIDPLDKSARRLKVEKIKDAGHRIFDGKLYHFSIEDEGSKLMDIYEVKLCNICSGKKLRYQKGGGMVDCDMCEGTGYQRVESKKRYIAEIPEDKQEQEELPF